MSATSCCVALMPVTQAHAAAIACGQRAVEEAVGLPLAAGIFDLLRMGDADFWVRYAQRDSIEPETSGYWIVLNDEQVVAGMCGCVTAPDEPESVEIGYAVSSHHEGRGIATEAARAVTLIALRRGNISKVIAHTLAEENASARVLTKCGFVRTGEDIDPDEGVVWRWERQYA